MDVALIERALKDADKVIEAYSVWLNDPKIINVARDQITSALIELRRVPTTCEPAKLRNALAPFAKVIETETNKAQNGWRPPIKPNEYISIYEHNILAHHFITAKEALDG